VFLTVWRVLPKAGAETGQNLDCLAPPKTPEFPAIWKNRIWVRRESYFCVENCKNRARGGVIAVSKLNATAARLDAAVW
jgi:hypothetical protein